MFDLLKKLVVASGQHRWCRRLVHPRLDYLDVMSQLFKKTASLVILDIGAYKGESILKFKSLFPNSTIYAFEPTVGVQNELEKVCNSYDKVYLYRTALSDRVGKSSFYTSKFGATNSLHPPDLELYRMYDTPRKQLEKISEIKTYEVDKVRLDDWIAEHKIKRIDILKTDTQGHECAVLEGGKHSIPALVRLVIAELHFDYFYVDGAMFFDVCSLMYELGFKLYDFFDKRYYRDKVIIECDGLFYNTRFINLKDIAGIL